MLTRITLNQNRFIIPGIHLDERGIAVAQYALVLLPNIERVVTFLKNYTSNHSVDDILNSLNILSARSEIKRQEFIIIFSTNSSYILDGISQSVKLLGGSTFIGTSQHFVQYRDPSSPLGYDAPKIVAKDANYILYHNNFTLGYKFEQTIELKSLVFRLKLNKLHNWELKYEENEEFYFKVSAGLVNFVNSYLIRNNIETKIKLIELPPKSAFDPINLQFNLYYIKKIPIRIIDLMSTVPGMTVYKKITDNIFVEYGYEHPLNLLSLSSIFPQETIYIFNGKSFSLDIIPKTEDWIDIAQLAQPVILTTPIQQSQYKSNKTEKFNIPIKIIPDTKEWKNICGVSISWEEVSKLKSLVYNLPGNLLQKISICQLKHGILIIGKEGIEHIPIGRFLTLLGENILIAAGYTISPMIEIEAIEKLLQISKDEYLVFEPSNQPYKVNKSYFYPLSKEVVSQFAINKLEANNIKQADFVSNVVVLTNQKIPRLPLWGWPHKTEDKK